MRDLSQIMRFTAPAVADAARDCPRYRRRRRGGRRVRSAQAHRCQSCGGPIVATRDDAVTCSPRCRQRLCRARRRVAPIDERGDLGYGG
jgi:hypothetical protein